MRAFPLLFAMTALGACAAHAQDAPSGYTMKQDEPTLGTNIKRNVVTHSSLPPDKTYDQLTAEEQALLKGEYEHLGAADEPPFPLHGMRPIYKALAKVQQKLRVAGDLTMFVDIDSEGHAVSVSVLQSPDTQLTQAAASVLMLQDYKPALCEGKPCRMQFPLRMKFTTSL